MEPISIRVISSEAPTLLPPMMYSAGAAQHAYAAVARKAEDAPGYIKSSIAVFLGVREVCRLRVDTSGWGSGHDPIAHIKQWAGWVLSHDGDTFYRSMGKGEHRPVQVARELLDAIAAMEVAE